MQSDASAAAAASAASQQRAARPDSAAAEALLERADKGRIRGDTGAKVWIVEVSDFQCPYCKMWHDSTYETISREFIATGQVRLAYVNFPLQSHANAVPAAEAAMCAAAQDKFWPMQKALFKSQGEWAALQDASGTFETLARKAGVKVPEWQECVKSGVMQRLIHADRRRGSTAGVNSTPHFFVGDEVIRGAAPATDFRAAILKARAKAASSRP